MAHGRNAGDENLPVVAVIGSGPDQDRSIAALNIALSAARDGAKVLLIDADLKQRALSGKVSHFANSEPSRFGWLNIGVKVMRPSAGNLPAMIQSSHFSASGPVTSYLPKL